MRKVALFSKEDQQVIFSQTALKLNINPSIVEKDFWVCFMLDHLFHTCAYNKAFVFKGGTSLSKSYHVIERFSEDIDLILDWRKIIDDNSNPWQERSRTKQDLYNKIINGNAADFYKNELAPQLNIEMEERLGPGEWISVDKNDPMVINFGYPQNYDTDYIVPFVRLEIGPLAEWLPSHITEITPFVAEKYPDIFEKKSTNVLTIDVERTFWEKLTILHKIANFTESKEFPRRYARHFYDVLHEDPSFGTKNDDLNNALSGFINHNKEAVRAGESNDQKLFLTKIAHAVHYLQDGSTPPHTEHGNYFHKLYRLPMHSFFEKTKPLGASSRLDILEKGYEFERLPFSNLESLFHNTALFTVQPENHVSYANICKWFEIQQRCINRGINASKAYFEYILKYLPKK